MTTVSETLNTAADLIEKRGWSRGTGWFPEADADEPVCAEGAIKLAAGLGNHRPAVAAVEAYLGLPCQVQFRGVGTEWNALALWLWNDIAPADVSEVVEVLRAAAVIEAARENENAAAEVTA